VLCNYFELKKTITNPNFHMNEGWVPYTFENTIITLNIDEMEIKISLWDSAAQEVKK
jgi:hypothetical protein